MRNLPQRQQPRHLWLALALLLALLGNHRLLAQATTSAVAAEATATDETPADPLEALNGLFRAAYARTRAHAAASTDPIVLVEGDDLVLLHDGLRRIVQFTAPEFHPLKTISHVPLAIYVILLPGGDAPLDEGQRTELRELTSAIELASKSLSDLDFSPEQLDRQRRLLADGQAFITSVLEQGKTSRDELDAFARAQGPAQMANVTDVARAQIDALDMQMRLWQRELSDDAWQRLRVVVMGSHTPREGNLAMQYFQKLLGTADPRRLIYAESLFEEPRALGLLGTVVLDTSIGEAFFGDPLRMHRDLLSDAATEYLKTKTLGR